MTGALIFDGLLTLMILGLALGAVLARDLFASVVLFIIYGLFIAIAWTQLDALDVALAEAAIGAGLTGVLLISASARLTRPPPRSGRTRVAVQAIGAIGGLSAAGGLAFAALSTEPSQALRAEVAANLSATGVKNPVTATLLNFRGYDTLLETIVLFAALTAAWALIPRDLWRSPLGARHHARPDGVLATFGRLLPPLGVVVAVQLFWVGADAPGGAFQGGAVLAAVWILAIMAGVHPAPVPTSALFRSVVAAGPIVFLGIAIAGAAAGSFLALPSSHAKPITLLIESALTLSIGATLMALVIGAPRKIA